MKHTANLDATFAQDYQLSCRCWAREDRADMKGADVGHNSGCC